MPNLGCSVEECEHNQNCLCSLNSIQVGGQQANTSKETCCESFAENSGGFKNAVSNAEPQTSIGCNATNCTYNESKSCCAECVEVNGASACNCDDTVCQTFKPQ